MSKSQTAGLRANPRQHWANYKQKERKPGPHKGRRRFYLLLGRCRLSKVLPLSPPKQYEADLVCQWPLGSLRGADKNPGKARDRTTTGNLVARPAPGSPAPGSDQICAGTGQIRSGCPDGCIAGQLRWRSLLVYCDCRGPAAYPMACLGVLDMWPEGARERRTGPRSNLEQDQGQDQGQDQIRTGIRSGSNKVRLQFGLQQGRRKAGRFFGWWWVVPVGGDRKSNQ